MPSSGRLTAWAAALGLLAAGCSPVEPAAVIPTFTAAPSSTALPATPPPASITPAPTVSATRPPAPDPSATALPTWTPVPRVRLMAVGDVMLARSIGERILRDGPDAPFAGVRPLFAGADLLVINLECALSERGAPQPKAYTFRGPPLAAEALARAGVDVAGLANNHALDYGAEALRDTRQLLGAQGIVSVGAGENAAEARRAALVERNGLRIAFLAYVDVPVEVGGFDTRSWIATDESAGLAWAWPDDIRADVTLARAQADVVIVLLHAGYEGRSDPNDVQRRAARAAIEAGAALVLGAHPHVLQGVERYQTGLIVYSLGNFIFDGFDGSANDSAVFSAELGPEGVIDYAWIPAVIEAGLPRPAGEAEASRILERLRPIAP